MTDTTTLTVRLPKEAKEKLGELAAHTRRSSSFLAADAITAYVERELAIIGGIREGIADMEEGRVISHEDVVAEIDAIIDAADTSRRAR